MSCVMMMAVKKIPTVMNASVVIKAEEKQSFIRKLGFIILYYLLIFLHLVVCLAITDFTSLLALVTPSS